MTTKKFTPTVSRGPGLTPGEIKLTPPQDLGTEVPPSAVQKILPYVMGGALLGMIGVIIAGGKQLSPYMLLVPLLMVVMVVAVLAVGAGGGKKVTEINAERREYLRYLAGLRGRVTSSATAQVAYFGYHAPHPDDLLSIVGTQRQWSRPSSADFYAAARVGVGDQPAVVRLLEPAVGGEPPVGSAGPRPLPEPVSHMWAIKFVRTYEVVHDCPKLVQLRTFPSIAVGGDRARAIGLLTAMVCHLAVFHPPEVLQIRVLTEDPDHPEWSWLKWLPHVRHPTESDAAGPIRMIVTRPDALADLATRGPHTSDSLPDGPHVVVLDLTGGKAGFPPDGRAGVTVITLGNHRGSAYRIRLAGDGSADDRLPGQSYRPLASVADCVRPQAAGRIARKLAGWSTMGAMLARRSRPRMRPAIEWHRLVGARTVEEVTAARWRMYTDTDRDRLRIPFGRELKTGNTICLDLKEAAESGVGPHGMLIGAAGSGKSEFLGTLILSLAAMTHPDQLNLLLIDFRDGSTFSGMEKLPHTAAVINMAGDADLVGRLQEVLDGELDRRQMMLRRAATLLGAAGPLSGVADYERQRERGAEIPPLPTLLVVVDEFAGLLDNRPDFVTVLERICDVGGPLRVHLLLATESLPPRGTRLDNVEARLTYRIALRTKNSQESRAVIGTPEAGYLTDEERGVGFIRVGMADPVKFGTVYTGEPYVPSTGPQKTDPAALQIRRFTAAPVLDSVTK